MRARILVIGLVWLAGGMVAAGAGEVDSSFCQTGLIAPFEGDAGRVDLASAEIRIRLPRPSGDFGGAHIRAIYELRNRDDETSPLVLAFPATGTGGPRVWLKINGEPVRSHFHESERVLTELHRRSVERWLGSHPEAAERLSRVPAYRDGTDIEAFRAAKSELETWLDERMGLSRVDAHTLAELMRPEMEPWATAYRVPGDRPWPDPLWASYPSLTEAVNLRWRNEGLFLDPHSGRLVDYYDPLGSPGDVNLVTLEYSIPAHGVARIVVDYRFPTGWDAVSASRQLQFALAQAKHWGHDGEVEVEIEVPRAWRKVRIRPSMELLRTTPQGRVYGASFTAPREDVYMALVH